MKSLELDEKQVEVLSEHLQRLLSDLSVEIASTDRQAFREEIKTERRVLQEILAQLQSPSGEAAGTEPVLLDPA